MLSDDDVRYHLRQAEIAVEVTEHEGETTMPFRPGYILELLQQLSAARAENRVRQENFEALGADNAALRARLAEFEDANNAIRNEYGAMLEAAQQRLAEAEPIIAAVYADGGTVIVGSHGDQKCIYCKRWIRSDLLHADNCIVKQAGNYRRAYRARADATHAQPVGDVDA